MEAGFFYPVPRFRRRNGNGKNPDGQGFKSGDFFAHLRKNTTRPLTVWIGGTDGKCRLLFLIGCGIIFPVYTNKLELNR